MDKKILILFLFPIFFLNIGAVDTDEYLVERPDGSVSIVYHVPSSNDSLETVLSNLGYKGFPVSRLSDSDLPADRTDRDFWKRNDIPIGSKVIVDTDKKQAHDDETAQKESEKDTVFQKLGISKEEFEMLNERTDTKEA